MPSPLQLVKQLRELEEDAFITVLFIQWCRRKWNNVVCLKA